ncbi:hypothetical protein PM082_018478 [Marasmius tenuissimus]|nr:hypothetical protein PM082_018478 [Marasmius tenuissimus]
MSRVDAVKVIDNTARYSIYPLVLHQFIRYSRRDEVKAGNLVEKGSTSLWKSAVGKSALVYDLWQMSKGKGPCSHSELSYLGCPLEGKSPGECLSVRDRLAWIANLSSTALSPVVKHIGSGNEDVGHLQEKYRWESGWTKSLLKTLEDTDANQLLVLAAFARSQFWSCPYAIVIDFPVSGEDKQEPPGEEEIFTLEGA